MRLQIEENKNAKQVEIIVFMGNTGDICHSSTRIL